MAGVLLTHCNHLYFDRKQVRKMQPYPPLQTLLAAACLRRDGWRTRFFDSTFETPEEAFRATLQEQSPELLVICEDHFNFLTKMCLLRNRELAFRMGQLARDAGIPVIVASSDASDNILPYLKECADFVVLGEVEQTLCELARNYRNPGNVAGIAFRDGDNGGLRITPKRPPIVNLDSLPLPAWDLVDMDQYRKAWTGAHGEFALNAISSRGCPFQCNWCAKPVFGSHYRVRSAQSVAGEMQVLKNRFRPDQLWFADDIFALSPSWTYLFAEAVEERSAQIPFKMQSRCDLMTRNTVSALRRAGCAEVWMGAESGSQTVLDAMDKGIRVEQIFHARENLGNHDIRVGLFLQFGYPGETWEDIRKTIDMVRRAAPDAIGVSVSYPLPGTRFYDLVGLQLGAKKNWNDSDDLAIMFQGRFSSEFYHALRDALHAEVDGAPEDEVTGPVAPIGKPGGSFGASAEKGTRGGLMDLLLTHGFFLDEDPKELRVMKPYPPLGILYISSHLRARGFDVEIYDSTFGTREELNAIFQQRPPSIVGIGANLLTRRSAIEILRVARDAGWKVVLGGPEPPSYPEEYLACGADVIVQGEAENTMQELVPALKAGSDLSSIPGIIFRAPDGSVVRTPQRPLIKDLDAQPWPDRERIGMDKYLATWRKHHGTGSVSLITARGCPYSCTWCSHSTFGRTHRRRSVTGVVDEIAWIRERYSPEMLWIADDVFTIDHAWLDRFAAEMSARCLNLPFECITRADRLNPRVAETLAKLGCFRVWIGSESGSQKILDAMKRGVTVKQVQDAVEMCRAQGIQTGMFLMWGYEGETLADIEDTVRHVKQCRPDVFLTTVSYPIKGTSYYKEVAGRLVQLGDWTRTTDREFRIGGRHSRRFYEYADQWLKAEVAMNTSGIETARAGLQETFQEVEA